MSNLLERFSKTSVGSTSKFTDYFQTVSPGGDFKRINDLDVILNSWNNILITPLRTYQFDPTFGSELYKLVFEPQDTQTQDSIVNEVVNRIQLFDTRATIKNVDVSFLNNRKGFSLSITVLYSGKEKELKLTLDENTYFKFFETTTY